jgi:hypothetical protein
VELLGWIILLGGICLGVYAIHRNGGKLQKVSHEKEQAILRAEAAERAASTLIDNSWARRLLDRANDNSKPRV